MKSHKRPRLLAALFAATFLAAQAVAADDNRINIPAPPLPHPPKISLPKITLPAPPPMIWLPVPQIHVAYDSPYPIFHHEGRYYLHHEDIWYLGPSYNGPWTLIKGKQVPKNLRKFRRDDWGQYQREAAHHFREGRDDQHHHFYADRPRERASWDDYERRSRRDGSYGDHNRSERSGRDDRHDQRDDRHNQDGDRDKHDNRKEKNEKQKHDD